eukprot:SAG11_NODE_2488_length_3295_cov_4.463079_5_plen_75_part_01
MDVASLLSGSAGGGGGGGGGQTGGSSGGSGGGGGRYADAPHGSTEQHPLLPIDLSDAILTDASDPDIESRLRRLE